jgi:nitroreductase
MELTQVLRRRHMHRAFRPDPLERETIAALVGAALSAPSAGNAQGVELVVLDGPDETRRYFEAATDADWRERTKVHRRTLDAPLVLVLLADPERYASRYREPDKAGSGLGRAEDWPIPYWFVDAGCAAMAVLLRTEDLGLAAAFLGAFRHQAELGVALALPPGVVVVGAIAIGQPAPGPPGRSASRPRRPVGERVHRGRFGVPWGAPRATDDVPEPLEPA